MNRNYDITVVVATYNPVWEKLHATLKSILEQKDIYFQIIVTDDGSENPLFDKTEALFKKYGFKDYKLVAAEMNEGTVCNFYRGVTHSDADYIKGISPGDLLFNELILAKWVCYIKEKGADLTFSDVVYYNRKYSAFNAIKHTHVPKNMSIYLKPTSYENRILNYVILRDNIHGAAIVAKKAMLISYLNLLLNKVIYAEDYFIKFAIFDNCVIKYFPSIGIWYEYKDGGISSTGEPIWKQRLLNDSLKMKEIEMEYLGTRNKKILTWLKEDYEYKKLLLTKPSISFTDKLKRYVYHPSWLYWHLYQIFFSDYTAVNVDFSFPKYCFDENK